MTTELDISALYDAVNEAESRNSKCTVVGRNNYSGYAKKTDNCSMPAANNVPPKQLLMYLVRQEHLAVSIQKQNNFNLGSIILFIQWCGILDTVCCSFPHKKSLKELIQSTSQKEQQIETRNPIFLHVVELSCKVCVLFFTIMKHQNRLFALRLCVSGNGFFSCCLISWGLGQCTTYIRSVRLICNESTWWGF